MAEDMQGEPMLTVEQLAARLNCSPDFVREKVRTKKWPHKKFSPRVTRFTAEHVAQIEGAAEVVAIAAQPRPRGRIQELMSEL
jgi:hypothetical protein